MILPFTSKPIIADSEDSVGELEQLVDSIVFSEEVSS